MVMDFQSDFMTRYKSPRVLNRFKEYMQQLVDRARREAIEIAWVRFLEDEKYQPATGRRHSQMQGPVRRLERGDQHLSARVVDYSGPRVSCWLAYA